MTHRQISLDWFTQINYLTTVSLVIALLAFAIGFYAFGKTQKTKGSVLTLGLCLTIGTWVFASAFIFSADPETGVWFWYYVQSFGFVPMWPILIHFFTLLSGLDRLPGKTVYVGRHRLNLNAPNIAVAVQYLLAAALHIWILTGAGEPLRYVPTQWGLRDTPNMGSLCTQIFVGMTLFWYAEGTALVVIFWRRSHRQNASVDMRKQSEVISLTGVVFGGITIVINIILPIFELPIPAFGSLFIGIWIVCITYAVGRYNLGAKDEQIIGQKAFDLSEEPIIVTDKELNILFYNRAFLRNFSDFDPARVRRIAELFPDSEGAPPDEGQFRVEGLIAALSAPGPNDSRRFYNIKMSHIYNGHELDRIFFILSDITEIAIQKQILEYLVDERTKEINRQLVITEKYTRPSLVRVIQAGHDPTRFEPKTQEIAIMFADIRDFTLMSEKLSSADTVTLLNTYFTNMNECIVNGGGEIDKLIGDAIMALFESADRAVETAVAMIGRLREYNDALAAGRSYIRNGIGIDYGTVTRGNIGSKEKLDYTVIGDSVNTASRFESLTKRYGLPIVISEEVVNRLTGDHRIRFIDCVLVKGHEAPTRLYEVFDHNTPDMIELKLGNQAQMEEAFAAYRAGDFERALGIYVSLHARFRDRDPLHEFYVRRTRELMALKQLGKLGPWNGTYQFVEK